MKAGRVLRICMCLVVSLNACVGGSFLRNLGSLLGFSSHVREPAAVQESEQSMSVVPTSAMSTSNAPQPLSHTRPAPIKSSSIQETSTPDSAGPASFPVSSTQESPAQPTPTQPSSTQPFSAQPDPSAIDSRSTDHAGSSPATSLHAESSADQDSGRSGDDASDDDQKPESTQISPVVLKPPQTYTPLHTGSANAKTFHAALCAILLCNLLDLLGCIGLIF